ncbi:MAG: hypothetical protein WBA39_07265 [Rivularia sp. (in: cyanobacteria)]
MTSQTTFSILNDAIATSQVLLTKYASGDELLGDLTTAFGYKYDRYAASDLITQWQTGNFSSFPEVEIRSSAEINGANGAYSVDTNKIYIAEEFLLANTNNINAVSDLVIEEYGHYVDANINSVDAAGDEGDIFSRLVRGESFSDGELQELKLENDKAVITLDGEEIAIEQYTYKRYLTNGNDNRDYTGGAAGLREYLIYGKDGNDTIKGAMNNDTLHGQNHNDKLYGDDGSDILKGGWGHDTLYGGNGNDKLYGDNGSEKGADKLYGEDGNDELHGGDYGDTLHGGNHNDKLYGGNHSDILKGDAGDDTLYGENGDDTFIVNDFTGSDRFYGGFGNDTIVLEPSDNRNLTIEAYTDDGYEYSVSDGQAGGQQFRNVEVIKTGNGNDTFIGSSKDETFNGGAGNDTLNGGDGNDTLNGSSGTNFLFGGEGSDTFVTESGGLQIIKDFERGVDKDKIDMAQAEVNQISFDFETTPGSTIIKVDGEKRVKVEGSQVDSSSLINTTDDINPQPLTSEQVNNLSEMLQQWAESYADSVGADPNKVQLVNNQLEMIGGDLTFIDYGEEQNETEQGLQIENMTRNASVLFRNNSNSPLSEASVTFTYSDGKGYEVSNQDTTEWTTGNTIGGSVKKEAKLPFVGGLTIEGSYERSWSQGGSNTKINTDNVNSQQQTSITFNAPGSAVTKATATATGGEYSGGRYEIPITISGTVGIDLNGDGDALDDKEINNLPVNAILQYYNPDQFVGDSFQKKFTENGLTLFYNETTQAKVTGTADGAYFTQVNAGYASAYDWSLNSPTTEQYENGFDRQEEELFGLPLGQGVEERFWLIRDEAYSPRPSGAVLRIEGFNISEDFIGIDHNAIDSDEDILLGTDVAVGIDPADKLILRSGSYTQNNITYQTTEILMGGTGDDFTTIEDNDVLAELISVSPDQLLGSSRESLTRGEMTSNFMFGTQGTVWDNNLASGDATDLLQLIENV